MNHKTVVLNAAKMNFDGNLDFSVLSEDVTVYDDTDRHTAPNGWPIRLL